MSTHVFVTYEEIFGSRPDKVRYDSLLRSLNKTNTLIFLARINNLLALFDVNHHPAEAREIQLLLFSSLFSLSMHEVIDPYLNQTNPVTRPIFQRPSILLLIKRVLEFSLDGDAGVCPTDDRHAKEVVGELCLMSNDEIQTEEQLRRTESDNPLADEESERVLSELLTQMLPISELMNPPEFMPALTRTLEYLNIYEEIARERFDGLQLFAFFERLTGLSPTTLLYLTYGAYAAVLQHPLPALLERPELLNLLKSTLFSNLDFTVDEQQQFFDMMTRDKDELVNAVINDPHRGSRYEQYDFTQFRSKPLFQLGEDSVTSIDISFMIEKVSYGLYHTLLTTLNEQGEDAKKFFGEWGKMFETYVTRLFRRVYPEATNRFFPNTFFDIQKSDLEAFDGLVDYFSSIFVFETKGGLMNTNAKYGGSASEFIDELDFKFGKKSSRSPISQIVRKLEMLFVSQVSKRVGLREVDLSHVKNIYPAIIVNDLSLQFGLCHWRLRKWFSEELERIEFASDIKIHPLMIITVDDLERLIPYLESGDFTLADFANYYGRLDYMRFPWFAIEKHWYEPMSTLGNVFAEFRNSRNIQFRPNRVTEESFENFSNSLVNRFISGNP